MDMAIGAAGNAGALHSALKQQNLGAAVISQTLNRLNQGGDMPAMAPGVAGLGGKINILV